MYILTLNPGATSTEVGLFKNRKEDRRIRIDHSHETLSSYVPDQISNRLKAIDSFISSIKDVHAMGARGGPLKPLPGGVYAVTESMLGAYRTGRYANHASNLGALMADVLTQRWPVPVYIVNPVTTDEMVEKARISGVPGIERKSRSHALNIKYSVQKAANELEISFKNSRFIVAHLGSGFSIAAVRQGKIIDVNDAMLGMGPFSVERAGALPLAGILDLIFHQKISYEELVQRFSKNSGLKGYLGTNDLQIIEENLGDEKFRLIYNAMIYQIQKEIGAMFGALNGRTDGLILTGGLIRSKTFVKNLTRCLTFLGPHFVYPGSFELEALAESVYQVLTGKIAVKEYD